jgi:hypothetical protein
MKKFIIAASIVLSFFAYSAEKWTLVANSVDSTNQLIVDASTFGVEKDQLTPNAPRYLVAKFKIVGRNAIGVRVNIVNITSCNQAGGEIWQRQHQGCGWVTTKNYIWSSTGDQFLDHAGQTLCAILGVRIRELELANAATPTLDGIH